MLTAKLHRPANGRRKKKRYSPVILYDPNLKSLPSVPKTDEVLDSVFQSDSGNSYLHGRNRRDLLRSTGHLFRDGRWSGDDSPFHAWHDLENPGIGARFTFQGGSYYSNFVVDSDPMLRTYNWVPSVARGFYSEDAFSSYDTPLPDLVVPDDADWTLTLNGLGSDFIRRFRPGNPLANLGEFVIELRDLPQLPRFLQSRAKHFSDLGPEYLNVEFGWKPFIKDLRQVANLQMKLRDELNKLIKNNGVHIKRRSKHEIRTVGSVADIEGRLNRPFGELANPAIGGDELLEGYLSMGPVPFGFFDPFMTGDCVFHASTDHHTESWYVGTYYYHVPDIGSDQWTERAIAELYGVSPHPSVIYRTYPWTWLADWFLNVGDIVSNLSSNAVDSEALGGGFVMHKDTFVFRINTTPRWDAFSYFLEEGNNQTFILGPGETSVSYSHVVVHKLRRQASPFGFGLRPGEFTTRQNAILLALANPGKASSRRFLTPSRTGNLSDYY